MDQCDGHVLIVADSHPDSQLYLLDTEDIHQLKRIVCYQRTKSKEKETSLLAEFEQDLR